MWKVGGTLRVQGELAVTRTLGACVYKPYVSAEPHTIDRELKNCGRGLYLVLASDGLWNVLEPEAVAALVAGHEDTPECDAADRLYAEVLRRGGSDNVTIIVVNLDKRAKLMTDSNPSPNSASAPALTDHQLKTFIFP